MDNNRQQAGGVKDSRKWSTLVFVDEWVTAVNEDGGFGSWKWAVSRQPGDVIGILEGSGHKT